MDEFLSQAEIDALLQDTAAGPPPGQALTEVEQDALGEIGNISMGTAATTLSQLLNQRVTITTPRVGQTTLAELFTSFTIPYALVQINYTAGLEGANILVVKVSDASIIANLMMGGDGSQAGQELDEIAISAVAEAMNQMIGSAATSMATVFSRPVAISPPVVRVVDFAHEGSDYQVPWEAGEPVVVISFRLQVGELIDSEIMQLMPVSIAKTEAGWLLGAEEQEAMVIGAAGEPTLPSSAEVPGEAGEGQPSQTGEASPVAHEAPRNLELILDVPLQVSVVLGRSRRHIKEVLNLTPGAVVELDRLANEPVEVLVNGRLIAEGEVVVINESFGVRITRIISPAERVGHLR